MTPDPGPNYRLVDTANEPWRPDAEVFSNYLWYAQHQMRSSYVSGWTYRVRIDKPADDDLTSLRERIAELEIERDEMRSKLQSETGRLVAINDRLSVELSEATSMSEERAFAVVNRLLHRSEVEYTSENCVARPGVLNEAYTLYPKGKTPVALTITGPASDIDELRAAAEAKGLKVNQ